ncbi:MAG: maleate cis-trans isomerase family protein [Candidatus Binatia bacterium]
MKPPGRIGLIIPSSNRLTEPQFHRYAPPGLGVHVTRLRMTGPWHRPLKQLKEAVVAAAAALADIRPEIIVFHCTASSMEDGLGGDAAVAEWIQEASGCAAMTTGQAITRALESLGIGKLVLITPYVKKTNEHEISYLSEAGFEVIHDLGLGLSGGDEYIAVTRERWVEIVAENVRPEAEGYVLSCTNTTMIEAIDESERLAKKPVVASNQAVLWACMRRLNLDRKIEGVGKLFALGGK